MREKTSGFKIEESQRQSWLSIAAVWAGGMICLPCLMIGGVLAGGGLSLGQIILSILIGYGIICAYMIFIGMQACDTGLLFRLWRPAHWAKRVRGISSVRCWPLPALAGSASSPRPAAARLRAWLRA